MSLGVQKHAIYVHNDIRYVFSYRFHESLKQSWTSEQTHWRSGKFVLSHTIHREGCEWSTVWFQYHLPRAGGQIYGRKDCRFRLTYLVYLRLPSYNICLMYICWLRARKSCTRQYEPSFFLTTKIGLLYPDLEAWIIPSFNHLVTVNEGF